MKLSIFELVQDSVNYVTSSHSLMTKAKKNDGLKVNGKVSNESSRHSLFLVLRLIDLFIYGKEYPPFHSLYLTSYRDENGG